MELPADAKVGQPAWEYLKLEDDYVIGIGLTPNRIDAASHIGVARDLAAYLKSQGKPVELQWPDVSAFAVDNHDLKIDVQVENSEAAPRYAGVTVKNCKIGPSPEWMQNCLRTAEDPPQTPHLSVPPRSSLIIVFCQPCYRYFLIRESTRNIPQNKDPLFCRQNKYILTTKQGIFFILSINTLY